MDKIDPQRVTKLVVKINDSYKNLADNIEQQILMMHMVGETDTEPLEKAVKHLMSKHNPR